MEISLKYFLNKNVNKMCGIIGYVGNKNAVGILLHGLKKLEYRGYDSAGISYIEDSNIQTIKIAGKINKLEKAVPKEANSNIGIGHTRWATHGIVNETNAHPHIDCKNNIAVVHNGIIENFSALKKILENEGHKFHSSTDSEVIAHLIEKFMEDDLEDAVIKALKLIEGAYGIAVISDKEPDKIVVARLSSPLVIGMGENENFVASDASAIASYTKKVIYLKDGEVASITKNKISVRNSNEKNIDKNISKIHWEVESTEKGSFPHFMLKEIYEQPTTIENAFKGRIYDSNVKFGGLNLSDDQIKKIERIVITSCGTSWHASLIGKYILEDVVKIPVDVEYASEFRYRKPVIDKNTLVLVLSQSGETADTLGALREAKRCGATVLGIVNVPGSTIARESDGGIYLHAGPEIGVASTKTFTSHIVVLYLLSIYLGLVKNKISKAEASKMINNLKDIPSKVNEVLKTNKDIERIAEKYFRTKNALYLGRGYNYPIALEGALKLKEISYIHAEGYPAAEMKHGPIALIDKNMPSVFIAPYDSLYKKILSNIEEVKARGGKIIAITTDSNNSLNAFVDEIIYVPSVDEKLMPILTIIPLQLLAYYIAIKRGCDVDKPRNLAKSVTVE